MSHFGTDINAEKTQQLSLKNYLIQISWWKDIVDKVQLPSKLL